MDAIEKAIRNAFEKGNAEDRTFREKVYRSAFAALDRALQANPSVTVETAINRRKAMQAKIAEIESEFLPAIPEIDPATNGGEAAPAVRPDVAPQAKPAAQPEVVPDRPREPASDASRGHVLPVVPDIMPEPTLPGSAAAADAEAEVAPDRDARRIKGRRLPLAVIVFGVALLAAVGIGLWWAAQTGAFHTLEEPGNQPSTPATGEDITPPQDEAAPQKTGEADQARDWITVFTPSDPASVSAPSDATAEAMKDDTGAFLRIRSGNSGSAISFDVGQGVLEQLSGKHAVFVIIARAEEGQETQISIDCNFGEMGDCGRKRYAVGRERNEYLFDVQFPNKRPGAAGTIAINSDFARQGRSVDIYEIRASVAK